MKYTLAFLLAFICFTLKGQDNYAIQLELPQFPNTTLILNGYNLFSEQELSKVITSKNGIGKLPYPKDYKGAAQIMMNNKPIALLLLNKENFTLIWNDPSDYKTLQYQNTIENNTFTKGMKEYGSAISKTTGLQYLFPLYEKDKAKQTWLKNELLAADTAFVNYINNLPKHLYATQYLKIRGLVEDMPLTYEKFSWRVPLHIKSIDEMDFASPALIHSGLYKDLLEGYINLIVRLPDPKKNEDLLVQFADNILKQLTSKPYAQLEVAQYLIKQFEQNDILQLAEHVSLYMLEKTSVMDNGSRNKFEQYRKMANGQIAPDIQFPSSKLNATSLHELPGNYKLVLFGSSECQTCTDEIKELAKQYTSLKTTYGLEVVFHSLDTEKAAYENFIAPFSWLNITDLKGWESETVKAYHVEAKPSYFLLDQNNKILAKLTNTTQLIEWLKQNGKKVQ